MTGRVRVDLTYREAHALLTVLGEVLDHPDATEATLPDKEERAAAYRGQEKIVRAWAPLFRAAQVVPVEADTAAADHAVTVALDHQWMEDR